MALPVVIPNTFANANASIPLSQLDNNFSTVAVAINGMANGAEALANVNITGGSIANASLSNVSISSGNVTINVANVTTLDATNVEVTNIKAKDGTASATIADSTGVMTIGSSVLTTTDINGGTIDGAVIGGSSAAAGSFTTLSATTDFSVTAPLVDVYFTSSTGTNRSNIRFVNTGGSYLVGAEDSVGGSFGATAYDGAFYVPSGKGFSVVVAGTGVVQRTTSTGLAVTGTISATQRINANASDFQIGIYDGVGDAWYLRQTGDTLAIHCDSTGDIGTFSSTGLAVTGAFGVNVASPAALIEALGNSGNSYFLIGDGTHTAAFGYYAVADVISAGSITNYPFAIRINNVERARFSTAGGLSLNSTTDPGAGNLLINGATITTGSTTALSLATSGGTQVKVGNIATAVNFWEFFGGASGAPGVLSAYASGTDTNIQLNFNTKGSGPYTFYTDNGNALQVSITHTASANRYVTITGSNGSAPTIGTSAGSLNLSPGGNLSLQINAVASQANYLVVSGTAAGGGIAETYAQGADTNISVNYASKGSGSHNFYSNIGAAALQAAILHTASATRYITLTGSNGGNPTIGTSAGSLAVTPSIVCSGAVYTGNNANAGIENVYNGAVAANANLDLPIHMRGGMVVIRDNSSGGTAIAIVDEATGVTIVSDPVGILATADPGAGGNKFWLQSSSGSSYTRITNRFGSSKAIGFSGFSAVF